MQRVLSTKNKLRLAYCILCLLLFACALKPPVQEMAEARTAVATAKQLPQTEKNIADMRNAEAALAAATEAMRQQHYDKAKRFAIKAKRAARDAANPIP